MTLSEYKVGDRVDIFVWEKKRPATVTKVSDEGVEVELDSSLPFSRMEYSDFISYLDPPSCFKRFLIKYAGIIDKIKE